MPSGARRQSLDRGVKGLRSRNKIEWRHMSSAFRFHFLYTRVHPCINSSRVSHCLWGKKSLLLASIFPYQCKSSNLYHAPNIAYWSLPLDDGHGTVLGTKFKSSSVIRAQKIHSCIYHLTFWRIYSFLYKRGR